MAGDPTITARATLDTTGYQKGAQSIEKSTSRFGKVGTVMAGVFGGNLLTSAASKAKDFFTGAVSGAMAAEQANARFATTLHNVVGATDAQVKAADKFLTSQSRAAAISKGELRPAYETLLRGTHSLTGAQSALKTALDVSAGTGRPLAQVSQAMTRGFMGSTGALGRLGVATKDAAGHALPMTKIMENLNKQFGGQAAKQADTAAGRMRNAQIQFKAFQVTLGSALLPAISALVGAFQPLLPILTIITTWAKNNPALFMVLVGAILAIVAAYKIWTIVTMIQNAAMAPQLLVIGAIVLAIAALVVIVVLIVKHFDIFRAAAQAVWSALQTAFRAIVAAGQWLWNWFARNWPLLLAILAGPFGVAVLLIIRNWQTIKQAFSTALAFLRNLWSGFVGFIGGIASTIAGIAQRIGAAFMVPVHLAQSAVSQIRAIWDGLMSFLGGIFGRIGSIASSIAGAVKAPINAVLRAWNALEFTVPQVSIGPIHFGGQTIGLPDIPLLQHGGVIQSAGLAYLHPAEVVTPAPGRTGPVVLIEHATFEQQVDVDSFMRRVAWAATVEAAL